MFARSFFLKNIHTFFLSRPMHWVVNLCLCKYLKKHMWTCPKWLIEIPCQGPNGNSQITYHPCHDSTFNLKIAKNIGILLFYTRALLGLLIIRAFFSMAKFCSKNFKHQVILEVYNHHKCGEILIKVNRFLYLFSSVAKNILG